MEIVERLTGLRKPVIITPVSSKDLHLLTKKRYFFSWRLLRNGAYLWKLTLKGNNDILGVMALVDFPEEQRIEIKLLAASKENVGRNKVYENIAACMIAHTCALAVKKYADRACVSLLPKTELIEHYISKYDMWKAGRHLFLEGRNLYNILKKYYYGLSK